VVGSIYGRARLNWREWFQDSVDERGDTIAASHYDSNRAFKVRQRAVLDWLGEVRGLKILDVGPGAGYFCQPLTQHNTVVGVDFIPKMLKYSANKGLLPAQADGLHLPFASGTFDAVICVGVLQHIDASTDFLAELLRVTKSDGQIYLETLNGDSLVRWLYYRLTPNKEFMHTYRIPDLVGRFKKLAPQRGANAATVYYPLPGYRRVGSAPGLSRYLSTAFVIRVK
jgi:ubiquinone/menaquinone biosynthesis C-methylase UbiE